jgi:phage gp46-like protein
MDLTLEMSPNTNIGDLVIAPPGLLMGDDLTTAIIISLFTNRRANADDNLAPNESRQGWWGDTYNVNRNDKIGSRLWLLRRAKMIDATLVLARDYALEALRWLIEDNVAQAVDVVTTFTGRDSIDIAITIMKPSGLLNFNFEYVWQDLNG